MSSCLRCEGRPEPERADWSGRLEPVRGTAGGAGRTLLVCLCLRGRRCGRPLPPPESAACPVPGGQGGLAAIVCRHKRRLFASPPLRLSLLTRQVWPGRGRAGGQEAWVSAPRSPGPPLVLGPRSCRVVWGSSSLIQRVFRKRLCALRGAFPLVSGFGARARASVGPPPPRPLPSPCSWKPVQRAEPG